MTKKTPNQIAEIKLTYNRKVKASERPKVSNSEDAYTLFRENWDDLTINLYEEFKILLLDRNNQCMGIVPISKGGVSSTCVDSKLVFVSALKARACSIILGHNHPSGKLKPSKGDIGLTDKLVSGGILLGISVLDHIILTDEAHTSLADEGLINYPSP
ncbi:MAG: JAB domain-containing protein [Bacteroidota bacterium]